MADETPNFPLSFTNPNEEEDQRRRIAQTLLAPAGLDASIFFRNSASTPGEVLGPAMPGALPDSAATGGNAGEAPAPEAPKVAQQLLTPAGSDLGNPRDTAGQRDTWAAKLRTNIEQKVDEVNQKDAAAASLNPFFRSRRMDAARLAHGELDQLIRLYGQVAPTEAMAPYRGAQVETEKARGGLYGAEAQRYMAEATRPRVAPGSWHQGTTGKWSGVLLAPPSAAAPQGATTYDTGVTGPLDLRKEGARGAGHYEEDENGERVWVSDAPKRPPPATRPGGVTQQHLNALVTGYNAQLAMNGPAAAANYLAALGWSPEELGRAFKAAPAPPAPGAKPPAGMTPATSLTGPPAGKKVVGRFNPQTGRIE